MSPHISRPSLPGSLALSLVFVGCKLGDGGKGGSRSGDGLYTQTYTATADDNGVATIQVDIEDGDGAFLVNGEAEKGFLAVESVRAPSGSKVLDWEEWTSGDESLTEAVYAAAADTTVNWPVREEDTQLSAGTWTVDIAVLSRNYYYLPGEFIDVTVQIKPDDSFNEGTVRALVVYAEGLDEDPDVVEATEAAVTRWGEIWGAYGVTLEADFISSSIDPDLPDPSNADDLLSNASESGDNHDVTVIIGDTVAGSIEYYGISGSIPGTLVAGPRSGVVISWLANAGGDGRFDETDIKIYGETIAHEVGHFAGLFHPVEMTWDYWDALEDTERCTNANRCESDLEDNLMFPYPVCSRTSCTEQTQLSDGQVGVTQRYTGAL